jgi:hypothetical protein
LFDSLLYDRVRIPVPDDKDRGRWIEQGWDPARVQSFIEILGDRARPLEWDEEFRYKWRSSYLAAKQSAAETAPDAFKMTRTLLVDSVPLDVTGVDTVSAYTNFEEMRQDADLTELGRTSQSPGLNAASIAWEFAAPGELRDEPVDLQQELDVLRAAVDLSNDTRYRKNRRAYWRWVAGQGDQEASGEQDPAAAGQLRPRLPSSVRFRRHHRDHEGDHRPRPRTVGLTASAWDARSGVQLLSPTSPDCPPAARR